MITFQFLTNCCLLRKCCVNILPLLVAMQVNPYLFTCGEYQTQVQRSLFGYRRRRREVGWPICNLFRSISGVELQTSCWFSFRHDCYMQGRVWTSEPLRLLSQVFLCALTCGTVIAHVKIYIPLWHHIVCFWGMDMQKRKHKWLKGSWLTCRGDG